MIESYSALSRARKHLDRKLSELREHGDAFTRPPRGWLRAIRDALGLTTRQLAARLRVTQSTVVALERGEAAETISLKTLRQAAEAMDCTLVYALVPRQPLDAAVRTRAEEKTAEALARLHHTMRLEDQALSKDDLADERERMIGELLRGNPRRLWDQS
jgi:predicted DNA-binding mobile mystery protein A